MNEVIQEMKARLAALNPRHLEIVDESALHAGHAGAKSGGHFQLTLVSPAGGWLPPGWGRHPGYGHGLLYYRPGPPGAAGWPAGVGNVRVTYTAGYDVPPPDVLFAMAQVAGNLLNLLRWPLRARS